MIPHANNRKRPVLLDFVLEHPKLAGFLASIALAISFSPKVSEMASWVCIVIALCFGVSMLAGIAEKHVRRDHRQKMIIGSSVLLLLLLVAFGAWLTGAKPNLVNVWSRWKAKFEGETGRSSTSAVIKAEQAPIAQPAKPIERRDTIARKFAGARMAATSLAKVQFQKPELQASSPFTPNMPVNVNETVINKGPDVANAFRFHVQLTITDLPPTADTADRIWRDYIAVLRDNGDSGNDLGIDSHQWLSAETPILSIDEVDNLRFGRHHLYLTGLAKYRDSSGRQFNSELCEYIEPGQNATVWHMCDRHNRIGHPDDANK